MKTVKQNLIRVPHDGKLFDVSIPTYRICNNGWIREFFQNWIRDKKKNDTFPDHKKFLKLIKDQNYKEIYHKYFYAYISGSIVNVSHVFAKNPWIGFYESLGFVSQCDSETFLRFLAASEQLEKRDDWYIVYWKDRADTYIPFELREVIKDILDNRKIKYIYMARDKSEEKLPVVHYGKKILYFTVSGDNTESEEYIYKKLLKWKLPRSLAKYVAERSYAKELPVPPFMYDDDLFE